MPGGTAGDNIQTVELTQLLIVKLQAFKIDIAMAVLNPAGHSVSNGPRLLVDLLEHKVAIAALFRHQRTPGDGLGGLGHRRTRQVAEAQFSVVVDDQLSLFEKNHLPCVGKHGRNVRGDKKFSLTLTDHQRRAELGSDHLIRLTLAENSHCVGTTHLAQSLTHGCFKVAALT